MDSGCDSEPNSTTRRPAQNHLPRLGDGATGERLARVGLGMRGGGTAEVGYWTAPAARGRGIAPAAVRAICRWAFEMRELELIEWRAEVGNDASRRVAEKAAFLLEGQLRKNGATRVVPGSHRRGTMPADEMPDPAAPHPDQRQLTGRAGDVVIFNSHLWHGGTLNRTAKPRRAMHSYFAHRDLPQQLDQQTYLRVETYKRLTPAQRFILDVTGTA